MDNSMPDIAQDQEFPPPMESVAPSKQPFIEQSPTHLSTRSEEPMPTNLSEEPLSSPLFHGQQTHHC
jgi:hypothetical protein